MEVCALVFPKKGKWKVSPYKILPNFSSINFVDQCWQKDSIIRLFSLLGLLDIYKKRQKWLHFVFLWKSGFFKRICFHFNHIFYKGCCLCSSVYGLLDTFYIMKRTIRRTPPSSFYPYTAIVFLITPECFWWILIKLFPSALFFRHIWKTNLTSLRIYSTDSIHSNR